MKATVKIGLLTYVDPDGFWRTALQGEEVEVHSDDAERVKHYNVTAEPETETPAGAEPEVTPDKPVEKPRGNASQEEWVEYALAQGATKADVAGKSRDELKAQFG